MRRDETQRNRLVDPRKETALLEAMRDYLDEIGWVALVGSVDRIQQGSQKNNFEFVLKFTGGKREVSA